MKGSYDENHFPGQFVYERTLNTHMKPVPQAYNSLTGYNNLAPPLQQLNHHQHSISQHHSVPQFTVQSISSSSSPDYTNQYKSHMQDPSNQFNHFNSNHILPNHHMNGSCNHHNSILTNDNSTHLGGPMQNGISHHNTNSFNPSMQQQQHVEQHEQPGLSMSQMPPPSNLIYPWMRQAGNIKTSKKQYKY